MLLQPGQHEPLKAAAHGAMGVLAVIFAAYNGAAWWRRRSPHLAVNAVLYSALILLEAKHIRQHVRHARGHSHVDTDAK